MELTDDYCGFIYAKRGWFRSVDCILPEGIWEDCQDFNPDKPPPIGTKLILMERNMIAVYWGRIFGRHLFRPLYPHLRIQGFRLKPYVVASNG